jgi:hypothetical protein
MSANVTESQKFLSQFITGWQRDWARRFLLIHREEENSKIAVPSSVDAWREFNRTLQSLKEDVTDIKETTHYSGNVLQTLAGIFKFGGKEMERHKRK